ncbi:MAG: amino acid adenylation domain-containing protein [Oscillospiraceae bacterium]|nr:amino acid adenylation domain-containing protein [Oscillospiraceae bacterium]
METLYTTAVMLVDEAAEKFGSKIAFKDAETEISFAELSKKSRVLASQLIDKAKTGRLHPVMVFLPKSIKSIVSFMGSMFAASPYVPMDYNVPMERFRATANNLRPCAVITDTSGKEKLEAAGIAENILIYDELVTGEADNAAVNAVIRCASDLDPAYIMYTSGSTGTPKGVTISHRAVLDYTKWLTDTFDITNESIIGMQSAFHFDNSVFDMFLALYLGCKTVIIPEVLFMYPEMLFDFMAEEKISVIFWVPTVMISVANSGVLESKKLDELRLILFAGEVMPIKQLNQWIAAYPDCKFVNMYGPTEATDIVLYYVVDREYKSGETLPIGIPCANMKAIILNENSELCAPGEQGELCIGGSGIAMGYWNSPEITSKAFVQNPLNNKYHDRIYRTGDLVYEAEDGNIIFLGRADSQIKLRGNRIELGDIEAAAAAMEDIKSCCAMFDAENEEIFLFLETDAKIVQRRFNMELKKYIPAYMVPQKIVSMPAFPHTPSGKIDRQTLKKNYIMKGNN